MLKWVLGVLLLVPVVTLAAATMQNDTESIALPVGANDQGQQVPIYDNPDLVESWVQGSTNYTDYYANLGTTFTVTDTGTVTVTVGQGTSQTTLTDLVTYTGGSLPGFTYTPPSVAVGSNGGTVTITGSKLRQALIEKGILSLDIKGWDFDDTYYVDDSEYYANEASFDAGDLALVAAAVVFRNQDIEEVSIAGNRINVTYRTQGWILWFIPHTFSVSLSINTAGQSRAERVSLAYPWYRIFMWLPTSPDSLAGNLDAVIVGLQAAKLSTEESQARLFTYVSNILKQSGGSDVSGLPRR